MSTITTVESIAELLAIQSPVEHQSIIVNDDLRGGHFVFNESKKNENNGGTIFNGWVRKYVGSVYLDWFCELAPALNDCSIALEKALQVSKGVKAGGRKFLFTGRVGIPDVEQSNYAYGVVKIHGDGDTVFNVDSKQHGRALFTSASAKSNPTIEANKFVGKVDFCGINFIGVNSTHGGELNEANKNKIDIVFDGDRLYNTFVTKCNFVHLNTVLKCVQGRGSQIESGNAYTQSFVLNDNHFFHNLQIVEVDSLINFTFKSNQCEMNYGGIKAHSKNKETTPAVGVLRIEDNLFESGGQFIDIIGDVIAGSISKNYLEYNIYEGVLLNLCQIAIDGEANGLLISNNAFAGQIEFQGYDTEYADIKINTKPLDDSVKTDVFKSKAVLIGNFSNSRQLNTSSRVISIGNSSPYWLKNGWVQEKNSANYFNSVNLHSHQENDVSFSRGVFNKPLNFSTNSVIGNNTGVNLPTDSILLGILDLSKIEDRYKGIMPTVSYDLNVNLELINSNVTIAHAVAKIQVGVFGSGHGLAYNSMYDQIRISSKLISLLQVYDVPFDKDNPSRLFKKQINESIAHTEIEYMGDGRYGIRLFGYEPVSVDGYGVPTDIYSTLSLTGHVGSREEQSLIGANASFIGYWW